MAKPDRIETATNQTHTPLSLFIDKRVARKNMDITMNWLTNNPEAAEALRKADATWEAARKAAEHLPLAEKVEAYRQAKDARRIAYDAVHMTRP